MTGKLKFRIRKSPDSYPDAPWLYSVPRGDDTYDYGNVETHAEAIQAVDAAIRLRDGKA